MWIKTIVIDLIKRKWSWKDPGEKLKLIENEDDLDSTVVSTVQENQTDLLTSEKDGYGSIYSMTNSLKLEYSLMNWYEDVDLNEPIEDEVVLLQ